MGTEADAINGTGSAAYYFLVKEQGNQYPPMLESTTSYHFLSFFISGMHPVLLEDFLLTHFFT
jgi:rhomboid-like protein